MTIKLADRVRMARHRQFVGRQPELALLQTALSEPALPFHVIYIHGVGGLGKSTLLQEYAYLCNQLKVTVTQVDARSIEPSPNAFLDALRHALGISADQSPFDTIAARGTPTVLLVDTYETISNLDDWFRDEFLGELSDNVLVALADRQPPSAAWRSDPGWQSLMKVLPLRNLTPDESLNYLSQRNVPTEQQHTILKFTYCHPLALSLVADTFAQRGDFEFVPQESLDIVRPLLERFVKEVPGPQHRAALELCGLVRVVTESLLSDVLETSDAHSLFRWLGSLSFIEARSEGLAPHDLARDALMTDLRWRSPGWYSELHSRARKYYNNAMQRNPEQSNQLLIDYIFLHRDNTAVQSFFDWQSSSLSADTMLPSDTPALRKMVAHYEGEESAAVAEYWLGQLPDHVVVYRDRKRELMGFLLFLPVQNLSLEQLARDPAARAASEYIRSHAPLREGEVATMFRFWMGRDDYQSVSPVTSLIFVNMVRHYLFTSGLAMTLLPCSDPDFWAPMFSYADLGRTPAADFRVGAHSYGVYVHDWRVRPPAAWLDLLASREMAATTPLVEPQQEEMLVVMSRDAFEAAVRDALRHYTRPHDLHGNPLLRSRLVISRTTTTADENARITALQTELHEVVNVLGSSPRDQKAYRALYHTFIQPAPTQEAAAELLDVPFSTYRRHLKTGIDTVVEQLWNMELNS